MIVQLLFQGIVSLFARILSIIPKVTELPFGIDDVLTTGMGYFLYVANLIPPLEIMFNGFMFIIVWKIGLRLIAMIPIIRGWFHVQN